MKPDVIGHLNNFGPFFHSEMHSVYCHSLNIQCLNIIFDKNLQSPLTPVAILKIFKKGFFNQGVKYDIESHGCHQVEESNCCYEDSGKNQQPIKNFLSHFKFSGKPLLNRFHKLKKIVFRIRTTNVLSLDFFEYLHVLLLIHFFLFQFIDSRQNLCLQGTLYRLKITLQLMHARIKIVICQLLFNS